MSTMHDGGRIRRGGRRGSEEEEEDDDEVVPQGPGFPKRSWRSCFGVMLGNEGSRRGSVTRLESYYSSSSPLLGSIIHPDDWWYVLWTHFILLWAVYSSFFTPLEFGFFRGLPENLFLLDIAGQFAFLIDIVIHFSVAYKDSRSHKMVYDRSQIALRYLKSRFSIDLLGCLPWDAIFKACGHKEPVRYMLWIRLSRALRVTEFFEKLEKDIRINYLFTRIVKLIVVELYCTHTAACIFYYLATTMPRSKERYTWIGSLKMGDYSYSNFRNIDLWTRYITSLYFAIVTMVTVGYGDIHAVNVREMIFIMIYVSFDMILGAYLLGNMTALIVKGSKTEKYRDKMSELIRYMNRNNLGKQISNEVKNHLRIQYSHQDTEVTALQDIPNSIRTKIQQKLYEPDITKVSLFKGCSPGFIKQIAVRVHEELFLPREVIIEQETAVDQLFILCHGSLEGIRKEDDKEELVQMDSPSYSTLGAIQLLCNTTFPYTVRASELCKILRLSKQSLTEILEIHFSDGRIILKNLIEGNDPSVSKKLLESDTTLYIMKHESELATRLNCAAYDGDLHRLKHLVAAGADPGLTDYNKKSPLHVAASRGHQEIVSFLIEQRVCIDIPDESGNTPLLEAIKHGHDQIVPLLVKAGASLMIDDAGGFLCTAVARRDTDLLKRTLDNGINPNAKNYDSRTPLHVAASEGSYSVASLLLEAGASVLAKDRWGSTPLDESRLSGDKNLIKLLEDAQTLQISEVADSSHLQADRLQKRKCTVFPSHPWDARDERGRQGIILWVPQTLQELIEEAKQRLGVEADSCILAENGGKVTDVDMISDGQNLYLTSSGAR
ncbi:potassium channel SKOR isoform X1 [Eucalyptus grandis]|uniref:potassium channel SKOR isoform X1 n=1 Tax=Eucalyptus grandis TaxID=71139 RepID=UPI00192EE2B1|nr:potassium channel SKOR isoform X1 [Eucalyptus grandis]XP_018717459.2 potassium channel SKOR isoform X1 [Eucalyptus grandis]